MGYRLHWAIYLAPIDPLVRVAHPPRPNMSESDGDELDQLSFAQRHGASLNKWWGYYRQGKQYGMEKKRAIAEMYLNYEQLDGGRPSISKIASELLRLLLSCLARAAARAARRSCRVPRPFTTKIRSAIFRYKHDKSGKMDTTNRIGQ
jgi:hypothetical protein